jgi:hypothetical protein
LNNAQYTIGNTDPSSPDGLEYVVARIIRMNKKSMTITYSKKFEILFQPSPTEEGEFVETTVFFTQTFEK